MHHLLRLIHFPPAPSLFHDLTPNKHMLGLSNVDLLHPLRSNLSLQHHIKHRPQKQRLKIKGISQSQRLPPQIQAKKSSIRISKNTYKHNNNPLILSAAKINPENSNQGITSSQNIQSTSANKIVITIQPDFQDQVRPLMRRKRNYAARREQKAEGETYGTKQVSQRRMRPKKGDFLKLIGRGCRLNQTSAINDRKQLELDHFRTLES